MKRRKFISGLTGGTIAATASPIQWVKLAEARLRQPVTWGGVYIDENAMPMPNLKQALNMKNNTDENINQIFFQAIRNVDWSNTEINLASLVDQDIDTTTDYGMILVFVAEKLLTNIYIPADDKTAYAVRVVGYNIVYNIKKRQIISSFGVRGRTLDLADGRPNKEVLPLVYFKGFSDYNNNNMSNLMIKKISKYPYSNKYGGKRFKVTRVITTPLLKKSALSTGIDVNYFKEKIGYLATISFSENTVAPVIPYTKTAALNTNLVQEMRVTSFDDQSALNTVLKLPDPDIGISLTLDGWNFNVLPYDNNRNQISLVMSLTISFENLENKTQIFSQQFYSQKDFLEEPNIDFIKLKDAFVYILHEELIDNVFLAINNKKIRNHLYDGIKVNKKGETTFLQAVTDDKKTYNKEYDNILEYLPYPM